MRPTGQHELTLRASDGLGRRPVEAPVLTSAYYDVPGGSLAAAGIVLLRRTDGGRSVWELRLPAEESCLELEEDGAQGQPPSSVPKLLQVHLRYGPLERIAELSTRRTGELVEVELELRSASPAQLGLLARELTAAGSEPSRAETAESSGAPIEAWRSRLRAQLREIERHDPGTRLGRDPESLHDMRVAVRRMRALLRAGKKLIAADMSGLDERLKELGAMLGEVRDLDVLLARLEDEAGELGRGDAREARSLLAALRTERSCSRARLLAGLRSQQYLSLLDDTAEAIADLEPSGAAVTLDDVADRAFVRARKAVHALPAEPADWELHRVRKLGKRARYAAELVGRKEFVRQAKALQDVLGEHQDAVVAAERLRELAAGATSGQAVAAGRLVERELERRAASRATWREAWQRLRKTI
jgi:CHAD domain-containing protein